MSKKLVAFFSCSLNFLQMYQDALSMKLNQKYLIKMKIQIGQMKTLEIPIEMKNKKKRPEIDEKNASLEIYDELILVFLFGGMLLQLLLNHSQKHTK